MKPIRESTRPDVYCVGESRRLIQALCAGALLMFSGLGARGESAGLNFVGMPAFVPQPLGSDTTTGWIAQRFWNNAFGSSGMGNLEADAGGGMAVFHSGFQAEWWAPSTRVSDTGGLMGTYLSGTEESKVVITVAGVPFEYVNSGYAVVVYYGGGQRDSATVQRVTKASVEGAIFGTQTQYGLTRDASSDTWKVLPYNSAIDGGTATPDGNVMVFRGLKDESFVLTVSGGSSTDGNSYGVINAMQVVKMPSLPALPPVITSSLNAKGTVGVDFGYKIYGEGSPASYGASGLPPGISLDSSSGILSGVPTKAGSYQAQISAVYASSTAAAVLTIAIDPAAVASDYEIVDLGSLGGESSASSINGLGQVVGSFKNGANQLRGFIYSGGQLGELGTLGGTESSAESINNLGQVVGSSRQSDGVNVPFLWTNGTMVALPGVGIGGGAATCINDFGVVTGISDMANPKPLVYKDGQWNEILKSPGFTTAVPYGINSSGQIAGLMRVGTSDYPYHATVWPAYPEAATALTDIGYPGLYGNPSGPMDVNNDSIALGINESGHAVGYVALSANVYSAFLYKSGAMQALGVPSGASGSFGKGVNGLDEVVGNFAAAGGSRAFVWDSTNGMRDLNSLIPTSSGWVLTEANALNDRGQIVGAGMVGGVKRAFLLNPRSMRSVFVAQPASQVIRAGSNLVMNVTFAGTAPVSYQWFFNGVKMEGQTGSVLTLDSIQYLQGGAYYVLVKDANGEYTSGTATITVQAPPQIDQQPVSLKLLQGADATFSVKAIGSQPVSYQWQLAETNLVEATNSSLTIASVTRAHQGGYRVIVSNEFGSKTSEVAQLEVIVPPKMSLGMYAGITLEGDPGQVCRIEYVEALGDPNTWLPLTTVTLTNKTQFYLDMDSVNKPKRFYRTVLVP